MRLEEWEEEAPGQDLVQMEARGAGSPGKEGEGGKDLLELSPPLPFHW